MSGVKKSVGKAKKRGSLRTFIKRICKDADIPMVNRDGLKIVEGAYHQLMSGLIGHTNAMLKDNKRRLTRKTARLAFIGYMDTLGAGDEICQEALERADSATESLFE